MGAEQKYHRLALECLELAEATHDPARQDTLIRMAELWARLADRANANSLLGAEGGGAADAAA